MKKDSKQMLFEMMRKVNPDTHLEDVFKILKEKTK